MCTNFFAPAQKKKIVAITMATPGMPNAQRGPKRGSASRNGQRIVEMNEPALIEK